jgi:hypothetical protein
MITYFNKFINEGKSNKIDLEKFENELEIFRKGQEDYYE